MPYVIPYRMLKTNDGRKTTFSVDTKNTVYDRVNGSLRKVGLLTKDGTIQLLPKYSAKYKDRLKQFEPKNSGCGQGDRQCAHLETADEECACRAGIDAKEFKAHLSEGKPCFNYEIQR